MLRKLLPPTGVAARFDDDSLRVGTVDLPGPSRRVPASTGTRQPRPIDVHRCPPEHASATSGAARTSGGGKDDSPPWFRRTAHASSSARPPDTRRQVIPRYAFPRNPATRPRRTSHGQGSRLILRGVPGGGGRWRSSGVTCSYAARTLLKSPGFTRRGPHPGPGDRRQHRDLQRDRRRPAPPAARTRRRTAWSSSPSGPSRSRDELLRGEPQGRARPEHRVRVGVRPQRARTSS